MEGWVQTVVRAERAEVAEAMAKAARVKEAAAREEEVTTEEGAMAVVVATVGQAGCSVAGERGL
jgi:hypothetical protein